MRRACITIAHSLKSLSLRNACLSLASLDGRITLPDWLGWVTLHSGSGELGPGEAGFRRVWVCLVSGSQSYTETC